MKPRWIILQRKLYGCGTLTWRWVLILSWDKHSRNSSKMRENIELKAQDGIFWQLFRMRLHSHSSAYSCNNWLNNTWFRKICFNLHCVKRVQIRSFPGPYFSVFIPEKTPYLDTFEVVLKVKKLSLIMQCVNKKVQGNKFQLRFRL